MDNSGVAGFQKAVKTVCLLCMSLLLSACLSNTSYAPVVNAWQQPEAQQGTYIVHKDDTIYSIAWTFGLDYRALAAANGLKPPYAIHPGQRLRMQAPSSQPHVATVKTPADLPASRQREQVVKVYCDEENPAACRAMKKSVDQAMLNRPVSQWARPARGSIVRGFSTKLAGNRGIDIAGQLGAPIYATAAGRVVYSGDGVRGYGNLLIIKHNENYLSAYAFNRKNLVTLGEWVRVGQVVAEMGRNNAGRVALHFEIRRNGKPVNPEHYIRS